MKVLKFGGTSVGSSSAIAQVIRIVKNLSQNEQLVVVVSAVGGVTDQLIKAAKFAAKKDITYKQTLNDIKSKHLLICKDLLQDAFSFDTTLKILKDRFIHLERLLDGVYLINELSPKTTDKLLSFGEQFSSLILSKTMELSNIDIVLKNVQELIITDTNHTSANVDFSLTTHNIKTYFKNNSSRVTLLPGFISKSKCGEITTLGRGGSDYTAAIIAAALDAKTLQIWTDVSGMYTTNPSIVKQAFPISQLSYEEAVELSHFGAKVLYPPTVQPVLDKSIPIVIKNTMEPEAKGTLISSESKNNVLQPVKGISNINAIALLTLQGHGMVGIPGFSKRLFETLSQEKINIILITQASSEHSICIGISEDDSSLAKACIDSTFENEIILKKIDPIRIESGLSIIAIVGDNMKSHQGISGKMFSSLGKNNVNIRAIAQGASERNISAVIANHDVKKALNTLHEEFFELKTKQINLFITGVGNVGERLISQILKQQKHIIKRLNINLRVIGLANSKTMLFDSNGIDLNSWKTQLNEGQPASIEGFLSHIKQLNLRNSIFIDITANANVAQIYRAYLKESISVIACNKIACSSAIETYDELKHLSRKYNAHFLFETNVGAGLPVIDTLNHCINSGDKVHKIQAVLSGSLNYIFNHFNAATKFHDIVKQAQIEGYTEPDPRIDLSGVDVARKILILARESGTRLNLEDIQNVSFLSDSGLKADSVEDFYQTLITDEVYYQDLYASAVAKHCRLKYVATFHNNKASVGLKEIPEDHPFYNLEGKDNIVMFYTERYPDQPMIIKGAGAGAEVTASGLFADIIRIANT
ncbi:MAG: bifunctional aspartate kinase/homoserine dehydrogenase I [Flavobacteriaceae bacterium]|nr:bifunctional aspartate kinase/homoserine dehydrogenase I [Flavobacteriaceae bacterium]